MRLYFTRRNFLTTGVGALVTAAELRAHGRWSLAFDAYPGVKFGVVVEGELMLLEDVDDLFFGEPLLLHFETSLGCDYKEIPHRNWY